jgi:DNA-binding NarL/FixJ family response regulator
MSQKEKYSAQVIKLKKEGLSVYAIAAKLKISRGVVNNIWYTAYPTAKMKASNYMGTGVKKAAKVLKAKAPKKKAA